MTRPLPLGTSRKEQVAWSGPALVLGQLAVMASNLVLSLSLGYAGGLAAVGAVAPAMLVFQLSCGVLQRALAEATLLAESHVSRSAPTVTCRFAVGAALVGGAIGAVAAVAAALLVPGVPHGLAVAYAAGVPFALVLDIGRSAGVAAGAARSAFIETAAWLVALTGAAVAFAAMHEPMGVCLSWAVLNPAFAVLAAVWRRRRPALRGLISWLRSRRAMLGPATVDALVVGLTPLLALQMTALLVPAETVGAVRVLQQVYGPLVFVSIALRRVLVYRRRADVPRTTGGDLRDGVAALVATAVAAAGIGAALFAGRELLPALAFLPVGAAVVAAGLEKAALAFSFGCSLSRFVRGEFAMLLRTRYVMLLLTLVGAPLLAVRWGASGYLLGSTLALVGYSTAVLLLPDGSSTVRGVPDSPSR